MWWKMMPKWHKISKWHDSCPLTGNKPAEAVRVVPSKTADNSRCLSQGSVDSIFTCESWPWFRGISLGGGLPANTFIHFRGQFGHVSQRYNCRSDFNQIRFSRVLLITSEMQQFYLKSNRNSGHFTHRSLRVSAAHFERNSLNIYRIENCSEKHETHMLGPKYQITERANVLQVIRQASIPLSAVFTFWWRCVRRWDKT
jgi:hypothetical protein